MYMYLGWESSSCSVFPAGPLLSVVGREQRCGSSGENLVMPVQNHGADLADALSLAALVLVQRAPCA